MTWEETILHLRTREEYSKILYDSYLNNAPVENVHRFQNSAEFKETVAILKRQFPSAKNILEIGSGNGTSAAALVLSGYEVTATDPDSGPIAGCAAIELLKKELQLRTLQIVCTSGESLPFPDEQFDLVYVRQALHHAENLEIMLSEIYRVLKTGGGLMALREHVIFNSRDKEVFLQFHPLQQFYHGENAYTVKEYTRAITRAGFNPVQVIKYFDSVINYYPMDEQEINELEHRLEKNLSIACNEKLGRIGMLKPVQFIYEKLNVLRFGNAMDERRYPGRMYSFVANKSGHIKTETL